MTAIPQDATDAPQSTAPRRRRRRRLEPALALCIAPLVVLESLRRLCDDTGLAKIRDDEVAVACDSWTSTKTVVDTPGYRPYLPWFQDVHTIDRVRTRSRSAGIRRSGRTRCRAS